MPFSLQAGKRNDGCGLFIKWKFTFLKWVSLTAKGPTGVIQGHAPFVSLTFGVHCGMPLHAGKRNDACCLLIKWEFIFQKWVSLTANGPTGIIQGHTPLSVTKGITGITYFWGPLWDALFSACRKRKCCLRLVNKVEISFSKMAFVDCKWSNWYYPWSYTRCFHSLLDSNLVLINIHMRIEGRPGFICSIGRAKGLNKPESLYC